MAVERAELEKERIALVEEMGRLEEAGKLLVTRIASARASYEKSIREVAEEQEVLEETHDEAVVAQEKASHMERFATERDQASWRRAAELLAQDRQLASWEEAARKREEAARATQADVACQNDELERGRAEVLRREEEVAVRKTDIEITAAALDAQEECLVWHETDAASASSALTAREELVAKREANAARLGHLHVGEQGLDKEIIGHLALGFAEIAQRLEALPGTVQELASLEGCALAQAVAEHILACYCSRDPAFPLEPVRQGMVEVEEAAAQEAIRDIAAEVAACFMREREPEPEPEPSVDDSSDVSSPPPEPADS
ncbi:uncharacterized protein LOC133897835 [Phragmites australis]|uniref:uncharacterized protein LOC133897835 n=1 Tax=Phragmites australis TaxID=29695 RepID=UPI002D776995|nr:uncharacterized protein LOC133897835 [Phragmites australis]